MCYTNAMELAHLCVHSHFTLLGSTAPIEDLVSLAAADGMSHLALTDRNALYGAVAFARSCRAAGIQPITGMTVTLAPPPRLSPKLGIGELVLLAAGPTGYRSLCRLSSVLQGSAEREAQLAHGLGWDDLRENTAGLIALTGGRRGWIWRCLARGDWRNAQRIAGQVAGLFGEGRTVLSLELHTGDPAENATARDLKAIGQRLGLPLAAVHPIYALDPSDKPQLRLLAAIDANCTLGQVPPNRLPDGGDSAVAVHWQTTAEMAERYEPFSEALAETQRIASRCEDALPNGRPIWPRVPLPQDTSPDEALAEMAAAGLESRYGPQASPAIHRRLEHELAAIGRHGFAPLFLVVADIVRYARQVEIPFSTRGSVANSLVAYCTGITSVDPIEHDLLFERFLNPAREDPPDIDLDFCSLERDRILAYVRDRYGVEHVALVSAMNTMQPKSAVRETAKAYGLPEPSINALVDLLPRRWHPDPRRREKHPLQRMLADLPDPLLKEVVQAAIPLIGRPHHLSVHAGGVTLTPGPLTDWLPLQWAPKGFLITQYDHGDVEALGLPKLDLLGIRALTVLAETTRLVRHYHDPDFRLDQIPPGDPPTRALLQAGATIGVFQCESAGAQRTLRQLQAADVRDLAIANAFFKPGPATGGMARSFVRRYRGEEPVSYLHPSLEPILGVTKGVLIFQEQILRVAREVAGLSWAQANQLRRGMSKFKPQSMANLQEQFIAGCQQPTPDGPGMNPKQATTLWEQVRAFAGYGFNQGHATAYADVSYRSTYLKAHWPAEFLAARLANWGGYHHPVIYMAEARRLGIEVRPPHVNQSDANFTLRYEGERPVLWMGLGQVRDLRRSAVEEIVAQRQRAPFEGLRDLMGRVPLQEKEELHLVRCGGLDGLGPARSTLLDELRDVRRAGSPQQLSFGFGRPSVPAEHPGMRLVWERRILGWPVSIHPLDLLADRLPPTTSLDCLAETAGQRVAVAGVRLPGWTGGPGFFLGDARSYCVVRGPRGRTTPRAWDVLLLRGRWTGDEWGGCWFQAQSMDIIEQSF